MAELRNPGPLEFDAVIQPASETGGGAYVSFPFDVVETFGVKGRVPVKVRFDDVLYTGSLVKYGRPEHIMPLLKEIQQKLGKTIGDEVHVTLELDTSERVVELSADMTDALTAADLLSRFRGMAFTHQREYARWINEAKRAETRSSRIEKMVEMIGNGKSLS
jgi:Domain of unknown function (DUF1905)/Bacteriocin-protection, YdeI or OmpD-Associated